MEAPAATGSIREALAALAHEQWSGWMRYLFGKCCYTAQGDAVIPKSTVLHWQRQAGTPYADLSEAEQDSDRKEADRVLALLSSAPCDPGAVSAPSRVGDNRIDPTDPHLRLTAGAVSVGRGTPADALFDAASSNGDWESAAVALRKERDSLLADWREQDSILQEIAGLAGDEHVTCAADVLVAVRQALSAEASAGSGAIRALIATWRENVVRARANADNAAIPAIDRRQCFGVSQAYEQCADELAALCPAEGSAGRGTPRGTYNCPECGWNEPHSKHAGELITELSLERDRWIRWWRHVALQLRVIASDCATSTGRRLCEELLNLSTSLQAEGSAAAPPSDADIIRAAHLREARSHAEVLHRLTQGVQSVGAEHVVLPLETVVNVVSLLGALANDLAPSVPSGANVPAPGEWSEG